MSSISQFINNLHSWIYCSCTLHILFYSKPKITLIYLLSFVFIFSHSLYHSLSLVVPLVVALFINDRTRNAVNWGIDPSSKTPPPLFCQVTPSPLLFRQLPLFIGFSWSPLKNRIFQWNPIILKFFILNPIPSFKSN